LGLGTANPGQQALAVHWAIENTRRVNPIKSECCQEGQCSPMAVRNLRSQSFTHSTAAMRAGHVGFNPDFDNKDKTSGIEVTLIFLPADAAALDVRLILLGWQDFF
jgi:hypothetical protein